MGPVFLASCSHSFYLGEEETHHILKACNMSSILKKASDAQCLMNLLFRQKRSKAAECCVVYYAQQFCKPCASGAQISKETKGRI